MQTELKQKWIAALRSGQYEQGRGALKKGSKFCCLGVLCDVAGCEWVEIDATNCYLPKGNVSAGVLNEPLRDSLGLDYLLACKLIGFNDSDQADFHQIADWIEINVNEVQ